MNDQRTDPTERPREWKAEVYFEARDHDDAAEVIRRIAELLTAEERLLIAMPAVESFSLALR